MISDRHDFEPPKAIPGLAAAAIFLLTLALSLGMAVGSALRTKGWF